MDRREVLAMLAAPLVAPAAGPLLIDSHVHVWRRDARFPFAPGRTPPTFDAPAETVLAMMAANGVARTVLIQMIHYLWDNRYLADVLRRHPDRFVGVCRVDPQDPAAPDTLSRLVTEDGFRGVRISPYADAAFDWIDGPLMPPLWRRCAELRVAMTVLTVASRLPRIARLVEANPELTVVIDHMADIAPDRPQDLDLLLALARYPRVFVKISHLWSLSHRAYPYADMVAPLKRLLDAFGAKRLMWGTDWPVSQPYLGYGDIVRLYRDHLTFCSTDERADILSGTAQRVWSLT